MKPAKCYLCCLGRRLGLEQKGAETLADHWQRRVWRWGINFTRISASFNFINQSQNYNIALDVVLKFNHVCVLLRCDGRRLQRDQGGGQVYQKWCYSAGFHRRGLCHDVRSFSYCSDTLLLNNNLIISSTLTLFFFLLRLLCSIQTTEAHQPGAVARGNCRGEGQSLHRHRVHGQGKKNGKLFFKCLETNFTNYFRFISVKIFGWWNCPVCSHLKVWTCCEKSNIFVLECGCMLLSYFCIITCSLDPSMLNCSVSSTCCVDYLNCVTGQPSGLPALSRADRPRWRLLTQVLAVSPLHLCSSTYIYRKDSSTLDLKKLNCCSLAVRIWIDFQKNSVTHLTENIKEPFVYTSIHSAGCLPG